MARRDYEIAFVGLQPGTHQFEYQIDDKFFEAYQVQEFSNCNSTVKLTLEKNASFMMLKFEVGGSLISICDRCGNDLPVQLWDEFTLVVKLVDNPDKMNEDEEDAEVFYIARTESILHIKDWIYEFINLTIPMQKICAEDEKGKSTCNPKVLDMLDNLNVENNDASETIWKGLEKFKNLDNNN